MEYKVKLTDVFLEEIEEICNYITNKLKNIDASNRLREKVIYNILLLENAPKMCAKIEKVDRVKRQYRRLVVNNYIILYTVDEKEKIVYIAHIYYGGHAQAPQSRRKGDPGRRGSCKRSEHQTDTPDTGG